MFREFTKPEIQHLYRLSRNVDETTDGFSIAPYSPTEGKEILIIPRRIPLVPDTDEPIDLTTPFCSDRVSELLRALRVDDIYMKDTYAAALRFGSHWIRNRHSYFQLKDPLLADAMQVLFLQEKPELSSGWMDLSSQAEDRLTRLASYSYCKPCPNSMVLHGFIIYCDHDSELLQQECSEEWRSIHR